MDLEGRRESSNVEDRGRSSGAGGVALIGGGIGTIVLVLLAMLFGVDPRPLLQTSHSAPPGRSAAPGRPAAPDAKREKMKVFISKVLASTEDAWHKVLPDYRDPKLVLFSDNVKSACGMADAAVGPFYCGGDENIYIDLTFYDDLQNRLGAPGDFAQAYVLAHEVGHHVQKLRGRLDRVHQLQRKASKSEANRLSVQLELQADFYAGVWAHFAKDQGIVEMGDIEEALQAASAIGDDRLQKQARGYVVPDSFTHGTSQQRVRWFKKGYETGDPRQGDTFSARDL